MDLNKAKLFLDKVNREFGRMAKDPDNIARIDVDIMLSYLRDLYDTFLSETPAPPPSTLPKSDYRRTPAEVKAPPPREVPAEKQEYRPPTVAPPPPMPAPKVETPVVSAPVEEPAPQPKIPNPSPLSTEEAALFEFKEAKELSEKLSETPINDLKRSIGLNDKLLFTRELFGNDKDIFDNALNVLNNCADYTQAQEYLAANYVQRFHWANDKIIDVAKTFIKLVRRRYK